MKKLVCFLVATVLLFSLCACRETQYNLTESQLDKLFEDNDTVSNAKYPPEDEIIGFYHVEPINMGTEAIPWNVSIKRFDDKIVLQALSSDKEILDPTEDVLKGIESSYNSSTGEYSQIYKSNDYTSSYTATLYIENDIVKIALKNVYIYAGEEYEHTGIVAKGYKKD